MKKGGRVLRMPAREEGWRLVMRDHTPALLSLRGKPFEGELVGLYIAAQQPRHMRLRKGVQTRLRVDFRIIDPRFLGAVVSRHYALECDCGYLTPRRPPKPETACEHFWPARRSDYAAEAAAVLGRPLRRNEDVTPRDLFAAAGPLVLQIGTIATDRFGKQRDAVSKVEKVVGRVPNLEKTK